MSTSKSALLLLWANLASFLKKNIGYFPVGTKLLFRFVCVYQVRGERWSDGRGSPSGRAKECDWLLKNFDLRAEARTEDPTFLKSWRHFFAVFGKGGVLGVENPRSIITRNAKCPIFWGNFPLKPATIALKIGHLAFQEPSF